MEFRSRSSLVLVYTVLGGLAALAIPLFFLAGDSWLDAARFVRAEARAGDLVVVVPAKRVDRLAAFAGTWAVAADPTSVHGLEHFHRIFWVGEGDAAPYPGLRLVSSRAFGAIDVRVLAADP